MSVSVYNTTALIGIVQSLAGVNRSNFILDTFFGQVVPPTGTAEIMFDVEEDDMGIAPFVSPVREGKILQDQGYSVKYFTPAYVKEKLPLNPFKVLKRMLGEKPLGAMSPKQREEAAVAKGFDRLFARQYRRLELMGIDALIDGQCTITGEGYPTVNVNYGRDNSLTKSLTSTAQWGESGVSPVDDVDDWLQLASDLSGIDMDTVVMDAKAWKLYEKDAKLKERRDTTLAVLPGSETKVSPGGRTAIKGAKLKCTLDGGDVKIYTYQQKYKHPDTGVRTNMIPDHSVIIGSSHPMAQGTRYFGTILDPELGYESSQLVDPETGQAMEFAPKTWTVPDPAQRILMLQSAPLPVLSRPNATFYALVRQP